MKKLIAIAINLTVFLNSTFGQNVDENTAKTVGQSFLNAQIGSSGARSVRILDLAYRAASNSTNLVATESKTYFYIFNVNSSDGFEIVSGNEKARPILGYSTRGHFDINNIPQNVSKWFEGYKSEMRYVEGVGLEISKETQVDWTSLKTGQWSAANSRTQAVGPLTQTIWNQLPYYNDQCPTNTVTGCVATAMAQIMKFWNYPANGTGFHSDNDPNNGTLSSNFGSMSSSA